MATTTIRVDSETHARLVELSEAGGATLIDTMREATEALERQRFGVRVTTEMAELRQDTHAWAAYLADAEATSVGDGIG